LRQRTVNIPIIKNSFTNNTPFDAIIYLNESTQEILLENPKENKFRMINHNDLARIVRLDDIETDWIKFPDQDENTYFKLYQKHLFSILNVFEDDIKMFDLNFRIPITRVTNQKINTNITILHNENFKCHVDHSGVNISGLLPFYRPYILTRKNLVSSQFNVVHIYFKIKGRYYSFPYGHTSNQAQIGHANICHGGNKAIFNNKTDFLLNFISSTFNGDMGFNIKFTNQNDITSLNFDMDKLRRLIQNNLCNELNLIEVFYYLCNEDFDNLDPGKVFLKLLKRPFDKQNLPED
jgi:hypothetical protein